MALFANGKYWGFIYLCLIVRETTRKYEHKVYLQDIIWFEYNRNDNVLTMGDSLFTFAKCGIILKES